MATNAKGLTDADIDALAIELRDGGPVQCPKGANPDEVLDRLRYRHSDMQEVHVAEESPVDGVILHA